MKLISIILIFFASGTTFPLVNHAPSTFRKFSTIGNFSNRSVSMLQQLIRADKEYYSDGEAEYHLSACAGRLYPYVQY